MGVEVGLLGDTPPFRIEKDERRERIGIGQLQYPTGVDQNQQEHILNSTSGEAVNILLYYLIREGLESGRRGLTGGQRMFLIEQSRNCRWW